MVALKCSKLQASNFIFFSFNTLATFTNGYFYGKSNEQVSASYETLITPPGWAFAIWGIIFLLEGIFTIWQLFQSPNNALLADAVAWWWVLACLFQAVWNFAFSQEMLVLSALLLGGIAISLAILCTRLSLLKFRPGAPTVSRVERLLVHFSFGLHGGWTAVATLLNINIALVGSGYSPQQQLVAAGITLAVASLTGLWFTVAGKNIGYGLALSWALFGIAMNQTQTLLLLGEKMAERIEYISFTLSVLMLLASLFSLLPYDESIFFGLRKESPLLDQQNKDTHEPDFNALFDS